MDTSTFIHSHWIMPKEDRSFQPPVSHSSLREGTISFTHLSNLIIVGGSDSNAYSVTIRTSDFSLRAR